MVASLQASFSSVMLSSVTVKNTFIECKAGSQQMKRQLSDSVIFSREVREEMSAPSTPRKHDSDAESTAAWSQDEVEFLDSAAEEEVGLPIGCLTVMVRHLPVKCSQASLFDTLTKAGFAGAFDFLYVPVNHKQKRSRGFAFINFVTFADASRFHKMFNGQKLDEFHANQTMAVVPADVQGFEATVNQFKGPHEGRGAAPLVLRPEVAVSLACGSCAQCGKQCASSWTFCPCCGHTL